MPIITPECRLDCDSNHLDWLQMNWLTLAVHDALLRIASSTEFQTLSLCPFPFIFLSIQLVIRYFWTQWDLAKIDSMPLAAVMYFHISCPPAKELGCSVRVRKRIPCRSWKWVESKICELILRQALHPFVSVTQHQSLTLFYSTNIHSRHFLLLFRTTPRAEENSFILLRSHKIQYNSVSITKHVRWFRFHAFI